MTKDVREQIADGIGLIYCSQCQKSTSDDFSAYYDCPRCTKVHQIAYNQADQILALLKENGWVDMNKKTCDGCPDRYVGCVSEGFEKWAKENGYAKLADDQTLPSIWYAGYGDKKPAEEAQRDMLKAGWKKVVE